MCNLNKKAREVFACDTGAEIYGRIITTLEKHNMKEHVNKGVLLGFSGGADSVMLLLFLLEYRRRSNEEFKILFVISVAQVCILNAKLLHISRKRKNQTAF